MPNVIGGMGTYNYATNPQLEIAGNQNDLQRTLGLMGLTQQKQLAGQQTAAENYRAQLGADASRYAANLHNQEFNKLYSSLHGALGGGGGWGGYFSAGGGQAGVGSGGPPITAAPVWNPQQIQQQVNAERARNDTALGAQLKQQQGELAGRGYAAGSPLQQALSSQQQMATSIANTQAGTQIPWQAAQANASQLLKGQLGQEQQYAARQQEAIQRAQVGNQYRMGIFSALSGLI